jgi:gliding motility-associated-like protein
MNYALTYVEGVFEILPVELVEVFDHGQITTSWGVDPSLPSEVLVSASNGKIYFLEVNWDVSNLNVYASGSYAITGLIPMYEWITNAEGKTTTLEVLVNAKPLPIDVTLNNASFTASVSDFFIPVGGFVVNDPVDNVHEITLLGDGYDNSYFEIKGTILFWSSKEAVAGRDLFTIVVQVRDRDGNIITKFFEIRRLRDSFSQLEINNTFTPNSDGKNDTWGVPELRYYRGARVQVFERSGERVFYTEDPDVRWDGRYNGKELPVGTYFWVIEIRETGEVRRGMLNLLRK